MVVRRRVHEYEIEVEKKKREKFIIGAWREQREKHGRWKFLFRTKQSGCHKDRNRRHESREQGVSPHGISYA